ncbi:AAA family ATPase [Streptomyces sp. NPDC056210]|uniref:AAA family ATPase n=1 Tax=Streptomyces sp. NPDC056210 TaxID=3345746 RepID=UPI0035DCE63F
MYSLPQSIRAKGDAGDPLPSAFKALDKAGIRFIRGQLALVCAAGGTGKSAFILNNLLKASAPIPALYFSCDSDAFVQLSRSIAVLGEISMDEAMDAVRDDRIEKYIPLLSKHPVRFNYAASPSQKDIERSLNAYYELYYTYPHQIILDNITNISGGSGVDGDNPFAGLEGLMDWASDMSRQTQANVVGLHHVTGPNNDGNAPISMSGVKGQITRVPALVVTLFKPDANTMGASAVKNRSGRADPSGQTYVELGWDGDHMSITDQVFSTTSY